MYVTDVVKRPEEPIGRYVRDAFPDVSRAVNSALRDLKDCVTHRPVGKINYRQVGMAVDYQLRIRLNCFDFEDSVAREGIRSSLGTGSPNSFKSVCEAFLSRYDELHEKALGDEMSMSKLCLSLAYLESIYRAGPGAFEISFKSLQEFLEWPAEETREVCLLSRCAAQALLVSSNAKICGNPVLGDAILAADGDLILDGCLIDVKVTVNPRQRQLEKT